MARSRNHTSPSRHGSSAIQLGDRPPGELDSAIEMTGVICGRGGVDEHCGEIRAGDRLGVVDHVPQFEGTAEVPLRLRWRSVAHRRVAGGEPGHQGGTGTLCPRPVAGDLTTPPRPQRSHAAGEVGVHRDPRFLA